MYFKEKENTNIDSEFEKNKKISLNFNIKKLKPLLLITAGLILLLIIVFIIVSLTNKSSKYTIELLGEETITITVGSDYIEPGYKAYDKNNNDFTSKVEINSNVDTSKPGEYEILYSIDNINKVRYVIVTDNIIITYIHLNGKKEMYLELGETYVEPGYIVFSSEEEDLTSKVKVTGKVNSNKTGTYEITYSVVDSKNVTTTTTRRITVIDKK